MKNITRVRLWPAALVVLTSGVTLPLAAQTPTGAGTRSAADAVIGNNIMQLRYLGPSPFNGVGSNLDYGALAE